MQKFCLFCERSGADNNLFCQELYCPAEASPVLLETGERLGDIEIIRRVAVLRSSALYEVRRGRLRATMKVAHQGEQHTRRLKREATLLRDLGRGWPRPANLPRLIPPYPQTTLRRNPYGLAVLDDSLLYYCLYEPIEGVPLRDLLAERSQMWINHVGWIVADLALAVVALQHRGYYHYAFGPEMVLVHVDDTTGAVRTVLADLGLASDKGGLTEHWYAGLARPNYTAPELLAGPAPRASYCTDVYGVGLLFYELLTGGPAFPARFRSDHELREEVLQSRRLRTGRAVDLNAVADLAERMLSKDPEERPASARAVTIALRASFGLPPQPRQSRLPSPRTAMVAAVVLLVVSFVIIFGVAMSLVDEPTVSSGAALLRISVTTHL